MLSDAQTRLITFTRSTDPGSGDRRARCNACGEVMISLIGPAALNRSISRHRQEHQYGQIAPTKET